MKKCVRTGDMHPRRTIRIEVQVDGDIILSIEQDGLTVGDHETGDHRERTASVEFCTSGGKSPAVLRALRLLRDAIEEDNQNCPISWQR